MIETLRGLALAATIFSASFSTAAYAVPVPPPNPADFSIVEGPGQYTVYNNSADWYIFAFGVSNPGANPPGASATTGFQNWQGYVFQLDLDTGGPVPAFAYATDDADLSDIENVTLTQVVLSNYIGPGTHSSDFHFVPVFYASNYGMLVVNGDGLIDNVGGTTSTTPLPAALPLFAGGVVAFGLLARRRKKRPAVAA